MPAPIIKQVAFCLILFLICEIALRMMPRTAWYESCWYVGQRQQLTAAPRAFIFIGTSRVAAAIDAAEFARFMEKSEGTLIPAFNFGMGYTTTAENYFALKWLSRIRKGGLNGCTIFIPCEGGMPSMDSWQDIWVEDAMPEFIVPYLPFSELPAMWLALTNRRQ